MLAKCKSLTLVALLLLPPPHVVAGPDRVPDAISQHALFLGLYPFDDALASQVDFLTRLSRAGVEVDRVEIESPDWKTERDYAPYLLHLGVETRPRLRVQNYLGEFEFYPPLKDRLSEGDWLKYPHEGKLQERLAWLTNTRTYRDARTWEQRAMEASLLVDDRYDRFARGTYLRVKVFEIGLADLLRDPEATGRLADGAAVVNEAERQLGPASPFRLRLTGETIEVHYALPLSRAATEALPEATTPWEYGSPPGVAEAPELFRQITNGAIGLAALDMQASALISKLTKAAARPRDIEAIRAATRMNRARMRLAAQWRRLPLRARANTLGKAVLLPNIRSLQRWRPSVTEFNQLKASLQLRLSGPEGTRAASGKLLGRIVLVSLLLQTLVNVADAYLAASTDLPRDEVSRKVARVAADLGLSLGLWTLGYSPGGLAVIAVAIALELGHHYVNRDVPRLADLSDAVTELASDAFLLGKKTWASVTGRNPSVSDWEKLRQTYFRTVNVAPAPIENPEGDPSPSDSDVEGATEFGGGATRSVRFSLGGDGGYGAETRAIVQSALSRDDKLVNFERLSVAFSYQYLLFTYATLQQLGSLNINHALALIDAGNPFGSSATLPLTQPLYVKFRNWAGWSWLPETLSLTLADLASERNLRNEVRTALSRELGEFIRLFRARKKSVGQPLKLPDTLEPREFALATVERVLREYEECFERTAEMPFGPRTPCRPSREQREAAIALRDYQKALADDLRRFPPLFSD